MDMNAIFKEFLDMLITGVLAILAGFLIALIRKGFSWLSAKIGLIESETARVNLENATVILEQAVCDTVTALQQTLGDDIKESLKNNDGKYTREDLLNLKGTAYSTVRAQLTPAVTEILEMSYGNLEQKILDMIETQVRNLKESKPVVIEEGTSKQTLLG